MENLLCNEGTPPKNRLYCAKVQPTGQLKLPVCCQAPFI